MIQIKINVAEKKIKLGGRGFGKALPARPEAAEKNC